MAGVGAEQSLFVAPIVYAFVFSQILVSGFAMVLTRYIADCLSTSFYRDVTASLFGMCAIVVVLGSIFAGLFLYGQPLPMLESVLSWVFFLEMLIIWVQSIYLTAVKRFRRLIGGFAAGSLLSVVTDWFLLVSGMSPPHLAAMLAVTLGMGLLLTLFFIHIVSCFGMPRGGLPFGFLPYFERHWRIGLASLGYMLGLFVPNLIIWQGPWGVDVSATYRYAPAYDVVTFYAFISILPLMVLFVVAAETNFYTKYAAYFDAVTRRGNLREIEDAQRDLLYTLWFELRQVVEFQFLFTLAALALSSLLLAHAGLPEVSVSLFNVLLFAVFFTGVMQVLFILLTYFDLQKAVLRTGLSFALLNAGFGLWGLYRGGPETYGFTFFLAAAVTLVLAWRELTHFTSDIAYYVYCAQPVSYRAPHGPLTRLARWLGNGRLVNLEQLNTEQKEGESDETDEKKRAESSAKG